MGAAQQPNRGGANDPIQIDSSGSNLGPSHFSANPIAISGSFSSDVQDPSKKRKAADLSPPMHYRSLQPREMTGTPGMQLPLQVQPPSSVEGWNRTVPSKTNGRPQKILPSPANGPSRTSVPIARTASAATQLTAGVQPVVQRVSIPAAGRPQERSSPYPFPPGPSTIPKQRPPAAVRPNTPSLPTPEGHIITASSFAPKHRWERAIFHPKPGHPLPPPGHPDTSDPTFLAGFLPSTAPRPLLPSWTSVPPQDEFDEARLQENIGRPAHPSDGVPPVWASKRRGLTTALEYYRDPIRTSGGSVYVAPGGVARCVVFEGKLGDGYGFWGSGKSVGTFVVPL
jgi:hypothetical protein